MVDAVVSYVVRRLGDYLIREAAFLRGVRNEVESLKKDLEWMLCFIKDAEDKQVDNALIRQWVSDIREIAYDCEDVLDESMVKVHDEGTSNVLNVEGETSRRRQGFFTSIKKFSCRVARASSHKGSNLYSKGKEKVSLYSIGKEIEALKKRVREVSDRCEMYGLKNINNKWEGENKTLSKLKQLRKTTSFALENNIVGFEDDTSKLLAKLLEDEPRRFVISIWGTGGLGKTTLARKLYHNNQVKKKFRCSAWVCVSQDYNIEDLLRRIIKSFSFTITIEVLEKMSEEDLKRYIHNSLQSSSYLVVIDDVWETIAWGSLKMAFPDNNSGSRVIMTTRKKVVAQHSDERTYVHKLPFLREDESWCLFCQKIFLKINEDEVLKKLGKEMVKKCRGLPLAITVLGGLLSTKGPQEWRLVRDHIWRNLSNGSIQIEYLLALSFNDLPSMFKLCLLYLGHFPEDYEIPTWQLIRLWVAEGFIPQNEEIMEDLAYGNLIELINRSLIQIDKTRGERVITCRVHDLMRDLAIQKAKELNLFHIYEEIKNSTGSSRISSCRRQVVYSGTKRYLQSSQQCNPLLRSQIFFDIEQPDLLIMCTRFRLLRVLNISSKLVDLTIPEEIGKLIHLKYLGLGSCGVTYVPPSILNLVSLQTLELLDVPYPQLPTEICKLRELRHLAGNFIDQYLRIDNLTNLQTLKYIERETWYKINPETLVNLRELGIAYQENDEEELVLDNIAKLKNLRSLSVQIPHNCFASLQPLSHCQDLVYLSLYGKIKKLPSEMHTFLPNLEYLWLEKSNLVDDPMPTVENLMNLTILQLGKNSYCGKKMVCTTKGFPRLKILRLNLSELEELNVAEGAMPLLRDFSVINNSNLIIPERLRSVPFPDDWEWRKDMFEHWI